MSQVEGVMEALRAELARLDAKYQVMRADVVGDLEDAFAALESALEEHDVERQKFDDAWGNELHGARYVLRNPFDRDGNPVKTRISVEVVESARAVITGGGWCEVRRSRALGPCPACEQERAEAGTSEDAQPAEQ